MRQGIPQFRILKHQINTNTTDPLNNSKSKNIIFHDKLAMQFKTSHDKHVA